MCFKTPYNIGVFDEGDDRRAMLHRPRFAHHLASLLADRRTGHSCVRHGECDVAVAIAEIIGCRIPVVGQFKHGTFAFRTVADEGQREAPFRVIGTAQQFHAENLGIEGNRAIKIADADHRMQDAHGVFLGVHSCGIWRATWRSSSRRTRQSGQSCSTTDQKRGLWFILLSHDTRRFI